MHPWATPRAYWSCFYCEGDRWWWCCITWPSSGNWFTAWPCSRACLVLAGFFLGSAPNYTTCYYHRHQLRMIAALTRTCEGIIWVVGGSDWLALAALLVSIVSAVFAHRQYVLNAQERSNPPWIIVSQTSNAFVLVNGKSWPVYNVRLWVPEGVRIDPTRFDMIAGAASVRVAYAITLHNAGDTLTVTWAVRPDGPRLEWSWPLLTSDYYSRG